MFNLYLIIHYFITFKKIFISFLRFKLKRIFIRSMFFSNFQILYTVSKVSFSLFYHTPKNSRKSTIFRTQDLSTKTEYPQYSTNAITLLIKLLFHIFSYIFLNIFNSFTFTRILGSIAAQTW